MSDRARPRDTQRARVYAWENRFVRRAPEMTLAECQALIDSVAKVYALRAIEATDGRARRNACWAPGARQIKLPRWARTRATVLHECAHTLITDLHGVRACAWHGREFVAALIQLQARYRGYPILREVSPDEGVHVLTASARRWALDFASPYQYEPVASQDLRQVRL